MEKELKIVFSVFLVYFIYALTSFFNSGLFLAPYFFAKITLVIVSLIFVIINFKTSRIFLLWLYFLATSLFAITDENTIGFLDYIFNTSIFGELSNSISFLVFSFIFYFSFHLIVILFYYISSKKKLISLTLTIVLIFALLLIFINESFIATIVLSLFFVSFFIFVQGDSELKNKTLRVISYQYLLLVLLGSFEYFI